MVTLLRSPNRSEKIELCPDKQWLVYPPTQWCIFFSSSTKHCVDVNSIIDQAVSHSSIVDQSQPCDAHAKLILELLSNDRQYSRLWSKVGRVRRPRQEKDAPFPRSVSVCLCIAQYRIILETEMPCISSTCLSYS